MPFQLTLPARLSLCALASGQSLLASLAVLAMTLSACAPVAAPSAAVQETPEERLAALGVELPTPAPPVANYMRAVRTGNLVFLAGHISRSSDGEIVRGKLGSDLTWEQGYEAAKLSAIGMLASLKAEIGELSKVQRIVRVTGMVNSEPDFVDQSKVVNGCSDFLVEVFGERAKHARAAVGMASLPLGSAVEIQMVVEVAP